jgi:hypothetical protein
MLTPMFSCSVQPSACSFVFKKIMKRKRCWACFPPGEFIFERTEKKTTWLADDKHWRHHQPIRVIYSPCSREKKSPSGFARCNFSCNFQRNSAVWLVNLYVCLVIRLVTCPVKSRVVISLCLISVHKGPL